MITLDNISKSFGGTYAVKDISLAVGSGEIFGLVGPNGAGKTTTIRMMTGLLRPDEGKIIIGAYDIVAEPIKAKSILGYVPDKSFLYEKLTAREFLAFISSIYNVEKSEALARMERLLELFGIKDIEDELVESFSQGMRQRLLFTAALIHNPAVLLIDEPFMGLGRVRSKDAQGSYARFKLKRYYYFSCNAQPSYCRGVMPQGRVHK